MTFLDYKAFYVIAFHITLQQVSVTLEPEHLIGYVECSLLSHSVLHANFP